MEEVFNNLLSKIKEFNPNPNVELIKSAWNFAKKAHYGQKRLSGDPTIIHPLSVAYILAEWKLDSVSIAAGLLHDTIEDSGISEEEIKGKFGEEVAELVGGVTKIRSLKLRGSKEIEFTENLRKMILVMAKDLRVVFLRLADRLHNMRTLEFLAEEKRIRIAKETLEVFAPLAERLGVGKVKGELEDLAFQYVNPDEYEKVFSESRKQFKKIGIHIDSMKKNILKKLSKEGVKARLQSREKHLYSLWKKLIRPEIEWDFAKVNDIVALRIIVDKVEECYIALGVLHNTYKPVPSIGVSDFIAQPKPNGYQSIHTKVFGPEGRIVEVQIRTEEMHEEAENGLAAHWYFTLKKTGRANDMAVEKGFFAPTEKIKWVKELANWQKEIKDSKEFIEAVKFDALKERIFVFSPKGDVFDLPLGSTPIDFAFAVHTNLPRFINVIKVNGKVEQLDYKLKNGDSVEIIKTKNPQKIHPHWFEFVVTATAKREIKKLINKS